MARMRKKADLPTKTCPVCGRPFSWRKKWAASWPEVVYCSERCRRPNRPSRRPSAATAPIASGGATSGALRQQLTHRGGSAMYDGMVRRKLPS